MSEHKWPDFVVNPRTDPTGAYRTQDGTQCPWCECIHFGSSACPYSPAHVPEKPWPKKQQDIVQPAMNALSLDALKDLRNKIDERISQITGAAQPGESGGAECQHANQIYRAGNTYCDDCKSWLHGGMPIAPPSAGRKEQE